MNECAANGCSNIPSKDLDFFKFPDNEEQREKWIISLQKPDGWQPTEQSMICSVHFVSRQVSPHPWHPDYAPSVFRCLRTKKRDKSSRARQIIDAELGLDDRIGGSSYDETRKYNRKTQGLAHPIENVNLSSVDYYDHKIKGNVKKKKLSETFFADVKKKVIRPGYGSDLELLEEDQVSLQSGAFDSLDDTDSLLMEAAAETYRLEEQKPKRGNSRGRGRGRGSKKGSASVNRCSYMSTPTPDPYVSDTSVLAALAAEEQNCINCQAYIQEIAALNQELKSKRDVVNQWETMIEDRCLFYQNEVDNYKSNLSSLKEKLFTLQLTEEFFKSSKTRVLMYTGLPNYTILMTIYNLVKAAVKKDNHIYKISHFQKFILVLMRLKMNFKFKDLANRFNIDLCKIERFFPEWIDAMHHQLSHVLVWPPENTQYRLTVLGLSLKDQYKVIKDTVPVTKFISTEKIIRNNHKIETVCASLAYISQLSLTQVQEKFNDILLDNEELNISYLKFIGKYIPPPTPVALETMQEYKSKKESCNNETGVESNMAEYKEAKSEIDSPIQTQWTTVNEPVHDVPEPMDTSNNKLELNSKYEMVEKAIDNERFIVENFSAKVKSDDEDMEIVNTVSDMPGSLKLSCSAVTEKEPDTTRSNNPAPLSDITETEAPAATDTKPVKESTVQSTFNSPTNKTEIKDEPATPDKSNITSNESRDDCKPIIYETAMTMNTKTDMPIQIATPCNVVDSQTATSDVATASEESTAVVSTELSLVTGGDAMITGPVAAAESIFRSTEQSVDTTTTSMDVAVSSLLSTLTSTVQSSVSSGIMSSSEVAAVDSTNNMCGSSNDLVFSNTDVPSVAADLLSELMGAANSGDGSTNAASVADELLSVANALASNVEAVATNGHAAETRTFEQTRVTNSSAEQHDSSMASTTVDDEQMSSKRLEELHLQCQSVHEELIDHIDILLEQLSYNTKLTTFDQFYEVINNGTEQTEVTFSLPNETVPFGLQCWLSLTKLSLGLDNEDIAFCYSMDPLHVKAFFVDWINIWSNEVAKQTTPETRQSDELLTKQFLFLKSLPEGEFERYSQVCRLIYSKSKCSPEKSFKKEIIYSQSFSYVWGSVGPLQSASQLHNILTKTYKKMVVVSQRRLQLTDDLMKNSSDSFVEYYTGFPDYDSLYDVHKVLSPGPKIHTSKTGELSSFSQFICVLLRLVTDMKKEEILLRVCREVSLREDSMELLVNQSVADIDVILSAWLPWIHSKLLLFVTWPIVNDEGKEFVKQLRLKYRYLQEVEPQFRLQGEAVCTALYNTGHHLYCITSDEDLDNDWADQDELVDWLF